MSANPLKKRVESSGLSVMELCRLTGYAYPTIRAAIDARLPLSPKLSYSLDRALGLREGTIFSERHEWAKEVGNV